MGFWDVIYSARDRLPDLSPARRAAYDCTSKVDQAVRGEAIPKLNRYLSDDENRAQIGLFATTLAKITGKYVVQESYKHIPGATVATKLISDTMLEVKRETDKDGTKAIGQKRNLESTWWWN
ncbi:hypothetical protein OSB04_015449 [Centaurea solstitialis]|uniref:Uncharacterized protein n=1 Tax=Centaurea solstitialis TaxID=347529 RepID=A0AA38WIR7_9ASTR|nr:hypothetical protein OSB04_015449 [Centaurea solstitialis]